MIIKKHMAEGRRLILAVCDEELLGQRFEENKKQLDLTASFYGGEKAEEAEVIRLLGMAYIVNAAGKKSVRCCIKADLCNEKEVPKIKGIPYFHAVLF